jgi:hypothetical protein
MGSEERVGPCQTSRQVTPQLRIAQFDRPETIRPVIRRYCSLTLIVSPPSEARYLSDCREHISSVSSIRRGVLGGSRFPRFAARGNCPVSLGIFSSRNARDGAPNPE